MIPALLLSLDELVYGRAASRCLHLCIGELLKVPGLTEGCGTGTPKFLRAMTDNGPDAGIIEMSLPDQPRGSQLRYRLTDTGRAWKAAHRERDQR